MGAEEGDAILLGDACVQLVGQREQLTPANHILIPRIMDPVNHLYPYHDYRMSSVRLS